MKYPDHVTADYRQDPQRVVVIGGAMMLLLLMMPLLFWMEGRAWGLDQVPECDSPPVLTQLRLAYPRVTQTPLPEVIRDVQSVGLDRRLGHRICYARVGDGQADIRCLETRLDSNGMQVRMAIGADTIALQSSLYGRFNIDNLMIVAGMLAIQGVDVRAIERALAAVTPVPGRMQPVREGKGPTVLVDYAHTPDGLEKALHASREHFRGRLWCVVGCGGNRDAGKRPQMAAVAERLADHLVFTSDNPRHEAPQAIIQDMLAGVEQADAVMVMIDRAAAVRHAVLQASVDDVVLIAGKGHERWQEIGDRKLPMDDLQLARAALRERNGGEQ